MKRALVRYGTVPEVVICSAAMVGPVRRGDRVVIQSLRGEQLGEVLEQVQPRIEPIPSHLAGQPDADDESASFDIIRMASDDDLDRHTQNLQRASAEAPLWEKRIQDWDLDLQLVDVEWTLAGDQRILYVLNDRGPDCTKLALRAAAAGLGIVAVQPVNAEGLVTLPATSTTNAAHCGSSGGGCGCTATE